MNNCPCCLCKAAYSDFKEEVCDDCKFLNIFEDDRGWIYFVRKGLGEACKGFYVKSDKIGTGIGQKGMKQLPWKSTFIEAQIELNKHAESKGWHKKLIKQAEI